VSLTKKRCVRENDDLCVCVCVCVCVRERERENQWWSSINV